VSLAAPRIRQRTRVAHAGSATITVDGSLDNDGSKFIAQTNKDAPNWKVVTFDLADEKIEFKELIPHDPDAVLGSVSVIRDDLLIVTYSRDVSIGADRL
jgi:protease II